MVMKIWQKEKSRRMGRCTREQKNSKKWEHRRALGHWSTAKSGTVGLSCSVVEWDTEKERHTSGNVAGQWIKSVSAHGF